MGIALACYAGLLAIVNLVQVITGRRLIKPSASKRPIKQLRRESAAASLAMVGAALLGLQVIWGVLPAVIGCGWSIIARTRAAV
jgi:hypothetical protein